MQTDLFPAVADLLPHREPFLFVDRITDASPPAHLEAEVLIRPENEHMVRTRLVCLENTHNRWGGRILPQSEVVSICDWAHTNGLRTHLDGARLWNAAAATGLSEKELCEPFDSVSVCFSKGLGAPVGSCLVGSREFVNESRRARKLFGGAMRQAGIIAAGALYALENHRDRLTEDHEAAKRIGDAVSSSKFLSVRGGVVETNIIAVEIEPEFGTADSVKQQLAARGIACLAISPQAIRMVTHLDVTGDQIDEVCQVLKEIGSGSTAALAK